MKGTKVMRSSSIDEMKQSPTKVSSKDNDNATEDVETTKDSRKQVVDITEILEGGTKKETVVPQKFMRCTDGKVNLLENRDVNKTSASQKEQLMTTKRSTGKSVQFSPDVKNGKPVTVSRPSQVKQETTGSGGHHRHKKGVRKSLADMKVTDEAPKFGQRLEEQKQLIETEIRKMLLLGRAEDDQEEEPRPFRARSAIKIFQEGRGLTESVAFRQWDKMTYQERQEWRNLARKEEVGQTEEEIWRNIRARN